MGLVLEALWGYYTNRLLFQRKENIELAWMVEHGYNDFACIQQGVPWDRHSRAGELLRVEAKSMNRGADESKAHFDETIEYIGELDQLLVLVWGWHEQDELHVFPRIDDAFLGSAQSLARLRDNLHIVRGGSFVDRDSCPDGCEPASCKHHGEPLNAGGKRERLTGPSSTRVSATSSYAANFGGLVRMLKTNSPPAREVFRQTRVGDDVAHEYISFIHRNFPAEETSQYRSVWPSLAVEIGIDPSGLNLAQIVAAVRSQGSGYQEKLRDYKPELEVGA